MKPIYIHSKLTLIDDELMVVGSTNLDNMSFFYSSELSAVISHPQLVSDTKKRLCREHLGVHWKEDYGNSFESIFAAFEQVASLNERCLSSGSELIGRPVSLMPPEKYETLLQWLYYPTPILKMLWKLGVDTDDILSFIDEKSKNAKDSLQKIAQVVNFRRPSPWKSNL